MVDKSLKKLPGKDAAHHGVNPTLVKMVREALNENGFNYVKIIVSGGFNKAKVELFEKENTPVDIYAVGSAMLEGKNDFTADIVQVNGKNIAKSGRKLSPLRR